MPELQQPLKTDKPIHISCDGNSHPILLALILFISCSAASRADDAAEGIEKLRAEVEQCQSQKSE